MPKRKAAAVAGGHTQKKEKKASGAASGDGAAAAAPMGGVVPVAKGSDPLKLAPLFEDAGDWYDALGDVIAAQPEAAEFIGPARGKTVVPLRELTFQALKPNPPEAWKLVVFGQNPYPRQESATGVAMLDAALQDWGDKRFGAITSLRCLIKCACIWKFKVPKATTVGELRALLDKHNIVSPHGWFQSLLTQGVLLLNAALTASTDGSLTTSQHTKFWRPIVRQLITAIFEAKEASALDSHKAIVFAWWGTKGKPLRKLVSQIEPGYPSVRVCHVEYANPAAMGDKFCNSDHFADLNASLDSVGLDTIDWLPNRSWQAARSAARGGDDGEAARMGQFVSSTLDLHKMYLERLQGVRDEKMQDLAVISGVMATPLMSFVDALRPVVALIPTLERHVNDAREFAAKMGDQALSPDEVSCLHLYTLPGQFFRRINAALRSPNRKLILPFFAYLRLFFSANRKLKKSAKPLFRGVNLNLSAQYPKGKVVCWWAVSSCTPDERVAKSFLGGGGTLFEVRPKGAISIMAYSAFQSESEFLLAPGTRLTVVEKRSAANVHTVVLEEADLPRLVD